MIRRRTITSYEWHVATGNETVVLLDCIKSFFRRLELIGDTEQLTTTGKNLFDKSKAVTGRINPDNGVLLPETSYTASDYIEVQEGETYFQTGSKESYYRAFYDADKKFTSIPLKGSFQITVPVGSKFLRVSGKEDINNWQIEKGVKATPYEPYTGGKPSPSLEYPQEIKNVGKWNEGTQKYEVDVRVTGKNLFNAEKARDITNWIVRDNDGYAKFPIRVGKGNKVTFSYTEKLTAGKGFYLGITQSETSAVVAWLYHSAETNLNNNKHTVVAAGDYIYLSCTKSGIQKFVDTIQTLQVEISDGQTPYEPYTEQILTLTSDRPITKWDKLVEQGGEYGWLYQSAAKEYIGDNSVELYDTGFYFKLSDKKIVNGEGYCKELKQYVNREENPCIAFNMSANIYAYTLNTQEIYGSTVSETKEYLKTHPLHLVYKTETTEFVPLPESEQTQLRNLHSYNGTTNINIDSGEVPCGINVEYKTKS